MKKVNPKILIIILISILLFSLISFYFFKNTHTSKIVLNKNSSQKVYDSHRLSVCAQQNSGTGSSEKYYNSYSSLVDGYKSSIDCSYALNSYYPEQKDEYFVIKDVSKGYLFYVIDGSKHILGSLNILGVKDNFLFYNFCYEGCSAPQYVNLNTSYTYGSSTYQVYPERIDILYRQGLPSESEMLFFKNRSFFVSLHDIFELNTKDFSIKKIKTINKDMVFGISSEMDGRFIPKFEKKENGILFKIYKDIKGVGVSESKNLDSYFLSI